MSECPGVTMAEKDVLQVCGCQKVLDLIALACDVVVRGAVQGTLRECLGPCAVVRSKNGVIAIIAPQSVLQPSALQESIKECLHSN